MDQPRGRRRGREGDERGRERGARPPVCGEASGERRGAPAAPAGTPQKAPSAPAGAPEAEAAPIAPSTRKEAWARFCAVADDAKLGKDERDAKFLELVAEIGKTTDYDSWTGGDWGRLVAAVDAWNGLPF